MSQTLGNITWLALTLSIVVPLVLKRMEVRERFQHNAFLILSAIWLLGFFGYIFTSRPDAVAKAKTSLAAEYDVDVSAVEIENAVPVACGKVECHSWLADFTIRTEQELIEGKVLYGATAIQVLGPGDYLIPE